MKSTGLIFFTIFVLKIKCQLPPCNLENHRDFIYVMINKATNATRCVATKLKNLLEGNVDATKCTALHHGKNYTILRRMRETGGYAQWDFCSDPATNKFDIQFCQYKQQCYDKEWIKDYLEPGKSNIEDSCQTLIEALKVQNSNAYDTLFVNNTWGCSFNNLMHELNLDNKVVHWIYVLITTKIPFFSDIKLVIDPPTTNHTLPITACRRGVYNKVFYGKKNQPTDCIIYDRQENKSKCVNMEKLFHGFGNFDKEPFESNDTGDYLPEYKRYLYKHRLAIYDQEQNDQVLRDIRNTIYKSFDPKFNISEKTFKLLDRADTAFFLSAGEKFELSITEDYNFRPALFCDLHLTHFPVSDKKIFNGEIKLKNCPSIKAKPAFCGKIEESVEYELVFYDKDSPKGCYIPPDHADRRQEKPSSRVLFTEAEKLLNKKNNNDEDLDPAIGIAYVDEIPQKPVKHYRRNYMAGVKKCRVFGRLRLHQAGHKTDTYHQPEWYFWSNLRRNNTIQDILEAISAALGYENDEKRIFTINNPWNGPPVNLSLSVNAFCRAIVEMIPFSRKDFQSMKTICELSFK